MAPAPARPSLARAPVVEALIDLQVSLPDSTDLETLTRFQQRVQASYPTRRDRRTFTTNIELGEDSRVVSHSGTSDGYIFTSADGRNVAQARLDGFTFSRLQPYTTWDELVRGARTLWNAYVDVARPTEVRRIAVRYINRLEIPVPVRELSDWLKTSPRVAAGLQQELTEFFMRLVIPLPQERVAILTLATEAGTWTQQVPLIFDIDAFRVFSWSPSQPEVWSELDALRHAKNDVFFESLTERMLEKYQ